MNGENGHVPCFSPFYNIACLFIRVVEYNDGQQMSGKQ